MRTLLLLAGWFALGAVAWPQGANNRVLGHLGQTIERAPIRANMSSTARVFYTAERFEYLIVNDTRFEQWYSVLLENGRLGFVRSDQVARLPYKVTASAQAALSARGTPPNKAALLQQSFEYIGTPYQWGGNSLTRGVDCSGFVQQLWGRIGVQLPRTAAQQALVGKPVARLEDLRPGDRLYFWEERRNKIGHTGIFLGFFQDGGAYFIHSSRGRGVDTDDLREPRWLNTLVAARR